MNSYYELQVINRTIDTIRLNNLDIIDRVSKKTLVKFGGDELASRYGKVVAADKSGIGLLTPSDSCLIYLEYSQGSTMSPVTLCHRLDFDVIHGKKSIATSVSGGMIERSTAAALVFAAPFKEGIWAAVHDPSWTRGHRRVVYSIDNKKRIPGRFAIDFIRLNEQGKYAAANEDSIHNWYGYGQEILAVCDGIVGSIRNDFAESSTMSGHVEQKPENASGNFISIDAGNNNWVFYEHLKPGSIIVRPGQRVKKGQVIGSLGFTGQTTGPHLHLHVANNNSALDAEGLPYVFEQYTSLGTYTSLEKFGKEKWLPLKPNSISLRIKEHPRSNEVIRFR